MNSLNLWNRFREHLCIAERIGLRLDISRMRFEARLFDDMSAPLARALTAMEQLESGAVANPDEGRMVGHYWLRAPELAPDDAIRSRIAECIGAVKQFADDVHTGALKPPRADGFFVVLVVGIGGSALGAQFICDALGSAEDPMMMRFIDNTDPDGIDRTLAELNDTLDQTLTIVVSKSGSTTETLNATLEVAAAYQQAGLHFHKHAVAITCEGSLLHTKAVEEKWLRILPMWDWIGGRTSVLSAAGLLPIALQGVDVEALLSGARDCDAVTRASNVRENPAALMALMWHYAGQGRGTRHLVILPYRDRLALLGRYLQQLIMESLGKELDRSGNVVHQGLTVYGNKGSTDQHAYVQQLRDGPNDFFVTFVEVLRDRTDASLMIEEDVTTGDYLCGFLQGTRAALTEKERESMTITLDELNARAVGVLVALFERTVGLYAELINVNAYHQPGVEAGKKAAGAVIEMQRRVLALMRSRRESAMTAEEIAAAIGEPEAVESVYHILEHTSANVDHGIRRFPGANAFDGKYQAQ